MKKGNGNTGASASSSKGKGKGRGRGGRKRATSEPAECLPTDEIEGPGSSKRTKKDKKATGKNAEQSRHVVGAKHNFDTLTCLICAST